MGISYQLQLRTAWRNRRHQQTLVQRQRGHPGLRERSLSEQSVWIARRQGRRQSRRRQEGQRQSGSPQDVSPPCRIQRESQWHEITRGLSGFEAKQERQGDRPQGIQDSYSRPARKPNPQEEPHSANPTQHARKKWRSSDR